MSLHHHHSRPPVLDNPPDDEPPLSLFQQTLREKDEEFYKTFPAARIAVEQDPYSYVWQPEHQMSSYLPGPTFQLRHVAFQPHLHYPYDLTPTQLLSQSPSSLPFDSTHPPSSHPTDSYSISFQNHYTAGYIITQLSPTDGQGEQLIDTPVAPLQNSSPPAFDLPYPVQPHHFHQSHQRVPSPVMDSLAPPPPPPDSVSIPSQAFHHPPHYHTPPHQAYYTAPSPLNANVTPSPTSQDVPPPLSPPALVQATYPLRHKPEQQTTFTEPLPSPRRDSSIPPSRRNSQHALHRSQRRYSPPYPRPSPSTHKSSGSGNTVPALVSATGWPLPSSAPTTPSGVNVSSTNVGTPPVDVVNTSGAAVTRAAAPTPTPTPTTTTTTTTTTAVVPAPLPSSSMSASAVLKPRPSMGSLNQSSAHRSGSANSTTVVNSKRSSDKKPALACVFCRGRKIACGPPQKDGDGKTCNQCHRRSLRCEYPTESRRGMRKKSSASTTATNPASGSLGAGAATLSDSNDDSDNPKPKASPKATSNKKR